MISVDDARAAIMEYNKKSPRPGNRLRVSFEEYRDLLRELIRSNHVIGGRPRIHGAILEIIDGEFYGPRVRHQPDMIM